MRNKFRPMFRAIICGTWILTSMPAWAQESAGAGGPFQFLPFDNPQEMLDRMFGTDAEAEKQALDGIEVSIDEEQRFGNDEAEAYLNWLRQQRVRLLTKGRDVDYLQELVGVVRPQMANADRY